MSKEEVEIKKESKKDKKEKKERKKEKKEKKQKKAVDEDSDNENESSGDSDDEEIAIDLNAGVPLSKKQKRLLKKGKLNLEKLAKKNPPPKPILTEEEQIKKDAQEPKKSEYGVWIGNLSFDTTKEDITRFIMGKTNAYDADSNDGLVKIEQSDFIRINIPKKENKIKGFAYVDLPSAKHVDTVISLSESHLNGRNLLIKNANSFEGRPQKDTNPLSKNPPSRILFVGNLSFDTTQDLLREHFRHCGDIVKIRMATFEDTGKCKGFAFIDFRDESGPTTALKSKLAKSLINRPLRLEYGEDRSKLTPKKFARNRDNFEPSEQDSISQPPPQVSTTRERTKPQATPFKRKYDKPENNSNKRQKSSIALATAQRASVAIVPSSGKKTTFD
ncbi:DEHA2F02860p [Debaryomyces hansenii CBS767]|jgi:RNA recognition motif-containing protein|uniref:DEHA2F02860p n=1 Tax=Debaryomyces hansenii (strain ATCC 36239 / CBS 767 / BCRC 21394 / JCM 1990 / NBRC 0083 / IGC 2968) TaxID=284592 RepID=Q6BMT1_DEBHA|nr:DEHA2F02860p [Debaryomyces hansenii CBS767]CAG88803.1 DEHA2F02860p [Debaryomyces hansenii CBS767]|eukprot:XP_460490.1 DEHA2F02860p [Debaryomyces hansenii CBS767]